MVRVKGSMVQCIISLHGYWVCCMVKCKGNMVQCIISLHVDDVHSCIGVCIQCNVLVHAIWYQFAS